MTTRMKHSAAVVPPEARVAVWCPRCSKTSQVGESLRRAFGYVQLCDACLDAEHAEFQRTTGRKLGLTCTCPACSRMIPDATCPNCGEADCAGCHWELVPPDSRK